MACPNGYALQEKFVDASEFMAQQARQSIAYQIAMFNDDFCDIVLYDAKTCESEHCKTHYIFNRLEKQFRVNGLTLPKQSSEIVINPKLIAKIPFYTFVITWIITLAYLIKL